MRNIVLLMITICTSFVSGCSTILEEQTVEAKQTPTTKSGLVLQTPIEIFQQSTNMWLSPQCDPYDYRFVEETLNEEPRLKEYFEKRNIKLSPTHYALRIYPKNEQEVQEVESNKDLKVSFTPFNYRKVKTESTKEKNQNKYDFRPVLNEQAKYTEEREIYDIEGHLIKIEKDILPILYVVWPIPIKLPHSFDFEIDYEVFIPNHSPWYSIERDRLDFLECKCVEKALNLSPQTQNNQRSACYGYIYQYDDWANDNIPVSGLKLRFELGSNITDITTDETGYFYINTSPYATATAIYEESRWKLTSATSSSPISNVLNNIPGNWLNGDVLLLNDKTTTIQLALHYHFYNSSIPILYQTNSIRIKIITDYQGHSGEFHPGLLGQSNIEIYLGIFSGGSLFAVMCHELGHYTHYLALNGFFNFETTHRLIKESYADYVGWYTTRTFYKNKKPSISYDLLDSNLSARTSQSWVKTETGSTSYYSPLFVDLVDTYNQHTENSLYNNDCISSVPHDVIFELIHKKTWNSIKNEMSNYIGQYFTSTEYNSFIEPYDYYF